MIDPRELIQKAKSREDKVEKAMSVGQGIVDGGRVYSETMPPPDESLDKDLKDLGYNSPGMRVISWDDYKNRLD